MRDRPSDSAHRRPLEAKLGRPLKPTEVSDHVDENKANNTSANLRAVDRGAHTAQHNRTRGLSKLRAALRMTTERKRSY